MSRREGLAMMSKLLFVVSSALVLAGLAAGCNPDVPANPTYTKDVQPIYEAHCVRCHGAGGMLNPMQINGTTVMPGFCYLQQYADVGACTGVDDCQFGAGSPTGVCNPLSYITRTDSGRMPPPPSEPLNDWEKDVITRWVKNGTPQ